MYSKLIENIYKYDKIFIHSHVNPDGDCLGASFGLLNIIKENFGKKRVYVVADKSVRLSFLGEPDLVFEEMYDDSLSIIVDTPVANRVSSDLYRFSETTVKLDHHPHLETFTNFEIVDSTIPSACQLVVEFALEFNLTIPKEAATALYTGFVTDTGSFEFKGVTPRTHELTAVLIANGADFVNVHESLKVNTVDFIKFQGFFLSQFVIKDDVAYVFVDETDIEKYGVSMEDASELVSVLGTIEGINKWVLFRQEHNKYKARIRSKHHRIDLIANKYGGGGHQYASGCFVQDRVEAEQLIQELLDLK